MTTHEINKTSLKDGQIILYQRADHKEPKWQARITVPTAKGFERRSLGTRNLEEAKRLAYEAWDALYAKVKAGGLVKSKSFKDVAKEYLKDLKGRVNTTSYRTTHDRIVPYSATYFGKTRIDEISKKDFLDYQKWRVENGLKKAPSPNTLRAEKSAMMGVFKFGKDRGYINALPDIPQPAGQDNRRPDFTRDEIKALFEAMEAFVAEEKSGRTGRSRLVLCNYVKFMVFTGVRVGEARTLKWGDIGKSTMNGEDRVVLTVSGKTGTREVIPQPLAVEVLNEMKQARKDELGGALDLKEPVFLNWAGDAVSTFRNGFQALLKFAKLDEASTGKRRVIYSLRHSYATQMIADSTSLFYLSKNMGTSIEMLERFYGHKANEDMAKALDKSSFGASSANIKARPSPYKANLKRRTRVNFNSAKISKSDRRLNTEGHRRRQVANIITENKQN